MTNRLRNVILNTLRVERYGGSTTSGLADHVYNEVIALAKDEASEHDKANERLRQMLEVAWRTMKRFAPDCAEGRRTIAGAILELARSRQYAWDRNERLALAEIAQDQEIAGLKQDVRMAEDAYHQTLEQLKDLRHRAEVAEAAAAAMAEQRDEARELVKMHQDHALRAEHQVAQMKGQLRSLDERPGFQTILGAIRRRQDAAHEQHDTETARALEVLYHAVDGVLLPGNGKAGVRVEFIWPRPDGMAGLRAHRHG